MKAVLTTNEEFTISSAFMQADNQLGISFSGIDGYDAFRAKLTTTSTKLIKVYNTDTETEYTPYENYTKVIPKTVIELEDGTLELFIIFEKPSDIELQLQELAERQTLSEGALNELLLGGE